MTTEDYIDLSWDIEASNLLNKETIDYCDSPFKLKDSFIMHCIVVEVHQTGEIIAFYDGDFIPLDGRVFEGDGEFTTTLEDYEPIEYTHKKLSEFKPFIKKTKIRKVIAHNQINYDLLACKLYYDMDYTVEEDTWCEKEVTFEDTLVTSKCLNPDRFGGHSLDNLGKIVGLKKIEFRKKIPQEKRFLKFDADMLYYCIRDVKVNTKVFHFLEAEKEGWEWDDPIALEKAVMEIITRQEHRGFKFDAELAEECIKELDQLMQDRMDKVNPILPPKPATKAFMKDFTPPAKQRKQNGEPTSYIQKFADKIGAELVLEDDGFLVGLSFQGQQYDIPIARDPLVTEQKATIDDSTHIKNWLVGLGWNPSEYKDKDLTTKIKKVGSNNFKIKRTKEEYEEAVEKYVIQTLNSNFLEDRCEHLRCKPQDLRKVLLSKKIGRSVKVLTNPNFTVGQDKDICPDLERFSEKFPYVKDVVEYLTYKHRRNTILGGGLDWEDGEEAEKGYLAYVREDGRIPTPADPCGAATSRFKHRVVANVPRPSSLYGSKLREQFGVEKGDIQLGFDFDSLEAKIEAHYCWKYEGGEKEYCKSLTLEKPNDVHSKTAQKISAIIRELFERTPAKAVKYGCTYGATPPKVGKIIGKPESVGLKVYNAFWEAAFPLKHLKDRLTNYWKGKGGKKFIKGIDGRKIPTRSEHALLNSLFQSAGVICAKRTMVIHDRKLKECGLLVDFFKDDWKNASFCQQLIAYHDEEQLELHNTEVKFEEFDTKEEANAFKKLVEKQQGKTWSDVQEVEGKFKVGFHEAGQLVVDSVAEASEYYNLNVPLTAGYMFGKSWKDCH